jgi:diguanylate cyclase (GGDEF)-like protein
MPDKISIPGLRAVRGRIPRYIWSLFCCFVFVLISILFVEVSGRLGAGANTIWFANGLLLAYLLIVPRWRWPGYMAAGLGAMAVGSVLLGESWQTSLVFNPLNLVEVSVGASLLRRRSTEVPRFTNPRYFFRFALWCVFVGPTVAGLLLAGFSWLVWHREPVSVLLHWLASDCVGIAVTTPVFIAIFQNSLKGGVGSWRGYVSPAVLALVTVAVFYRASAPLLFIVWPFLLIVLLRSGMGWAGIGTLYVAVVGGSLTAHGLGPLGANSGLPVAIRPLILQVFLLASLFMLYSVSVVLESHKSIERKLQDAYRAVEALAVKDALTGVANRRRLDEHLDSEWRRAIRDKKPLSLLFLDVDHFKTYNDAYGHLRGDDCLKQIAQTAAEVVCRAGDLVARYGGEEFAVVLPGIDAQSAEQMAQKIGATLSSRKLPHQANPLGVVTISIGCATLLPSLGESVNLLLRLADEALYRAKQTGRNRVCVGR